MLEKEIKALLDFQALFEVQLQPIGIPKHEAPDAVLELNRRIIDEELNETLHDGIAAKDIVEIADGVADSIYVIAHATTHLGRTPNAGLDAAASLLLSEAISRINLVLTPGAGFVTEQDLDRNLSYAAIVVRGIAAAYGIPTDEVFAEVHRSNMTKVWPDGRIRKNEFGKVMKPDTYEPAKIKEILTERGLI